MHLHLLRVTRPVVEFESLIAAVRHRGDRVGWLELAETVPAPLSESLSAAADRGVLRAVAVGGGRAVALKPMRGEPVLRDILREHFRGCRLVLVMGEIEAPLLEPEGEGGWRLRHGDGTTAAWATERLAAALAKPRPWG